VLGVAKKAKKTASAKKTRKAPAKAKKKSVKKSPAARKKTVAKKAPPKKKAAPKKTTPKKKAAAKKTKAPARRAAAAKPDIGPRPKAHVKRTHLRARQLRGFREMLLEKRRTLVGDLSGMANETFNPNSGGNLSSMPTHMADVGTDNFEHEFTLGLLESEQAMLREINEALVRIEEKTYGICMGTGEAIPLARLRAKPWAKYTVDYTRMLEKGLVREPDPDDPFDEDADEDEE